MTPTNTPDLKPCPFCGCDAWIIEDCGDHGNEPPLYRPQCRMCGASRGGYVYRDNAILAWNLRAPDEALIAKVEALEGKEEGSAGSDLSPASRSHTPLSAGWQIVGREPKDAYALVYSAAYKWRGLGGLAIAYRHDSYNGHRDVWTLDGRAGRPVSGKAAPTHWMPLPPPPAESSPSGAQRSELAISAPDDPKSNSGADQ